MKRRELFEQAVNRRDPFDLVVWIVPGIEAIRLMADFFCEMDILTSVACEIVARMGS